MIKKHGLSFMLANLITAVVICTYFLAMGAIGETANPLAIIMVAVMVEVIGTLGLGYLLHGKSEAEKHLERALAATVSEAEFEPTAARPVSAPAAAKVSVVAAPIARKALPMRTIASTPKAKPVFNAEFEEPTTPWVPRNENFGANIKVTPLSSETALAKPIAVRNAYEQQALPASGIILKLQA